MSLIDAARDALRDLPVSDIIRERLSLALDLSAEKDAKIEALQMENAKLQVLLENDRLDHQKTREELQRLKDEHAEEIRIHKGIEFRRGKRTGHRWAAFCPQCHMPAAAINSEDNPLACSAGCGWDSTLFSDELEDVLTEL